MTIGEASRQGVARIRLPIWNEQAYLKLHLVAGGHGPWADLYDPPSQFALKSEIPEKVLILFFKQEDWESFSGKRFETDME